MRITFPGTRSFALLAIISLGCHRATPPPSPAAALVGDWTLLELDGQPAPAGAGGQRATLRFDTDASRVSGFAGCNRLTAGYALAGDSLRFGFVALTRMACAEGEELESRFAQALSATNRFAVTGTSLTLLGPSGPVARFARGTP